MQSDGRICILVVEDHADTAEMIRRLLTRAGYEVITAATADEAVGHVERCKLIISDIGLPQRSGLDLMRALRREYAVRSIALSGYATARDEAAAHAAGFDRFLRKPVEFGPMLAAVRALIAEPPPLAVSG